MCIRGGVGDSSEWTDVIDKIPVMETVGVEAVTEKRALSSSQIFN